MKMLSYVMLLVFMAGAPFAAMAGSEQAIKKAEYDLNTSSPNAQAKHRLGTLATYNKKWVAKLTYDFAVQGGAIGAINLAHYDGQGKYTSSYTLPKNAIITSCIIDTITALTSGGSATVAIGTGQTASDIKAATAYASYTALLAAVPVGTAATAIKLTADRVPTMTIAVATLTAGKFNVDCEYYLSP